MYRLRIDNTISATHRQGLQTCDLVSSIDTVTTTVYSETFSSFSTGSFTAASGSTVSNVYPSQLKIESIWTYRPKASSPTFSVVAGKTYKIKIDLVTISAGTGKTHTVRVRVYYPGGNTFTDYTTSGTKTFTFTPGSSGNAYVDISSTITPNSGGYSPGNPHVIIDNLSISYDSSFTVYDTVCNYSKNGYRYGFNGMEKVNEIAGEGNDYDFGARIYDGRLGRWFSVDKFKDLYPSHSAYCFAINSTIYYTDPDGNTIRIYYKNRTGILKIFEKWKTIDYVPNTQYNGNNKFVKAVYDSYNFILKSGGDVNGVILDLATSETVFNVKKAGSSVFDYYTNTIRWDMKAMAIKKEDGSWGYSSAAVGLFHETSHAYNFKNKYCLSIAEYKAVALKPFPEGDVNYNYDNQEEFDVINYFETPLINAINKNTGYQESARNSHDGGYVGRGKMVSVISIKTRKEERQEKKKIKAMVKLAKKYFENKEYKKPQ